MAKQVCVFMLSDIGSLLEHFLFGVPLARSIFKMLDYVSKENTFMETRGVESSLSIILVTVQSIPKFGCL